VGDFVDGGVAHPGDAAAGGERARERGSPHGRSISAPSSGAIFRFTKLYAATTRIKRERRMFRCKEGVIMCHHWFLALIAGFIAAGLAMRLFYCGRSGRRYGGWGFGGGCGGFGRHFGRSYLLRGPGFFGRGGFGRWRDDFGDERATPPAPPVKLADTL